MVHFIRRESIMNLWPYVMILAFVVFLLRDVIGKNTFYAWDMIPRFTFTQVVSNSFYLWDPYLNRPNFRAIQSMVSIWILYYKIQWVGIFISYITLMVSEYLFFKKLFKIIFIQIHPLWDRLILLIGVMVSSLFIYISDGYWYHSIVLSLGFMVLALYLILDYIYSFDSRSNGVWKIYLMFLLVLFSPMVTYNYLTLLLFIFLYALIKIQRVTAGSNLFHFSEDIVMGVLTLGLVIYGVRVVLPSIEGSVSSLEYSLELKTAAINPAEALIPVSRLCYFYNLMRFDHYLSQNHTLILLYLFPTLSLLGLIYLHKTANTCVLIYWLDAIFILSILSATGHGIYSLILELSKIPFIGKLISLAIYPIRKPTKWILLVAIVEGFLITIPLRLILSEIFRFDSYWKRMLGVITLFILILSPFSIYPFNLVLSGNLGGAFSQITVPNDYIASRNELNNSLAILIFPIHVERPTPVIANKKMTDEFLIYFYNKISYEAGGFESYPYNTRYIGLIYKGLILNESSNIGSLLTPLGVSAIVLEKNTSYRIPYSRWEPHLFSYKEFEKLKEHLEHQRGLDLSFNSPLLEVYKISKNTAPYISHNTILNLVDAESMVYLSEISPFTSSVILNVDSTIDSVLGTSQLNTIDTIILPLKHPQIPLLLLINRATLITNDKLRFEGEWDNYKYAYLGMSELSKYYKIYGHLGFPTYSRYPLATHKPDSTFLWTPSLTNGTYTLFCRCYSGNTKTVIEVVTKNYTKEVHLDPMNHMSFVKLGTFYIQKDSQIKFKLVTGTLIVDSLIAVPYPEISPKQILHILDNRSIWYILTPSDFRPCNTNASSLCSQVEILIGGTYTVHEIVNKGNINVSINGISVKNSTYLKPGLNNISISGNGTLKLLALSYSKKKTKPIINKILTYVQESPTKWDFFVYQDKPSFLVFPEAYDQNWEAEIYNINGSYHKINPMLGYSSVNVFYINDTGFLKIKIYYRPQNVFWIGLILSILFPTILGMLVILKKRKETTKD